MKNGLGGIARQERLGCKHRRRMSPANVGHWGLGDSRAKTYLIIVIFFTLTKFLETKIYTEKRQFFALNM